MNFLDQTAEEIEAQLRRPLREHLADYRLHLAGRGSTARHVRDAMRRVRVMLGLCRTRDGGRRVLFFFEISPSQAALAKSRLTAPRPRRRAVGPATVNHYVGAARSFGKWMVDNFRAHRSPFLALKRLDTSSDIRHARRALSAEEVGRLISTTSANGRTIRGIPADERSMMYLLASTTGLRAGELESLTPESFVWVNYEGALSRWVVVKAQHAKSGKQRRVPLRADVAAAVSSYLETRAESCPAAPLFRRPSSNTTVALREDLRAAGIAYCIDGAYADFHALRHTCLSRLAAAGVPVTLVRDIAGHACITTTNRYMHAEHSTMRQAVERISIAAPIAKG